MAGLSQASATIVSALVGAGTALITLAFKDYVFVRVLRRDQKVTSEQEVLRLYVAPLITACEKLVWRFSEIFLASRHQFLKSATLPLTYNEYKRGSTLFRIAVLLGWMRAIQLELNALPRGGLGFHTALGDGLEAVRVALADGPAVEVRRLHHLGSLWKLPTPPGEAEQKLAFQLEVALYKEAGDQLRDDEEYLRTLPRDHKLRIVRAVADMLCQAVGRSRLSDDVLNETVEQAIHGMGYRQALIYRDWQDAIGDSMLHLDEQSDRRFATIGFVQFSEKLAGDSLWMSVFRNLIVDIDFDEVDSSDFRADQLRALCVAVSRILTVLSATRDADLIDPVALKTAQQLAELIEPDKPKQ